MDADRDLPVSPMEEGTGTCNSTSRDCALVPGRAHRWQDHITECTEGASPWVPGFPAPAKKSHDLGLAQKQRAPGSESSGLDPDAQKIQGPSFSKCHISLLDSCITLRKEPSSE